MPNAYNEQRFYEALENIFTGVKIEGQGGFVNLFKIKSAYYRKVLSAFQCEVAQNPVVNNPHYPHFKEEFFDKLYAFFEKYFSESGSVYFVKTAAWQRVYEREYTDNKDVVLFWKTHMLYYVKTDVLYHDIRIAVPLLGSKLGKNAEHTFYFDCTNLTNKQHNAKKALCYTFKELHEDNVFVLGVSYSENGKKTRIEEIVTDCNEAIRKNKDWRTTEKTVCKAIKTFEKQKAADFFINKDAQKFLTEQLELYLHHVLLEEAYAWEQWRLEQLKTIKEFAQKIIAFISQFENELVRIWNKSKFVLRSNYVITLDKLPPDIVGKLAKHSGMKAQISVCDIGIKPSLPQITPVTQPE